MIDVDLLKQLRTGAMKGPGSGRHPDMESLVPWIAEVTHVVAQLAAAVNAREGRAASGSTDSLTPSEADFLLRVISYAIANSAPGVFVDGLQPLINKLKGLGAKP